MVNYRVTVRNSKAAKKRLQQALETCRGELKDSFCLDPSWNYSDVVHLVALDPARELLFYIIAKPRDVEYSPPTYLTADGCRRAMFSSPMEEIEAATIARIRVICGT